MTSAVQESYLTGHRLKVPNMSRRNTMDCQTTNKIRIMNLIDNYQTFLYGA